MHAELTIGRVAKEAGVGLETIRYYERLGLIEQVPRSASGYRIYPETAVRRLLFIRRAKGLGFSLKEIKELLSLRRGPNATCGDIKEKARAKMSDIEAKVNDLLKMREALARLAETCPGEGPLSACPILGALGPEKEV